MTATGDTRLEHVDGGWWPPGEGEPGTDWGYEKADLALVFDGKEIDVLLPTATGDRALASIPLAAVALLLAEHFAGESR